MDYIVLDFETFYNTASGFTLKKLSTPEYIGHKDFKVHCLGVEMDGRKKILWGGDEISLWLRGWRTYKGEYAFVFHNAWFDLAILKWVYKFTPARSLDTLQLANHVLGSTKDSGKSNALADLAQLLGLPAKGHLEFMDGVHEPDAEQRAMMEVYLNTDLDLTRKVLDTLLPYVSNPDTELWLLNHGLQLYTERSMVLNYATVDRAEKLVEARRAGAIKRLMTAKVPLPPDITSVEQVRAMLPKKAFEGVLLDTLKQYDVALPRKVRKITAAERGRFEKLKADVAKPPEDGSDRGIRGREKTRAKFENFLTKLQTDGADVWEENGEITLGETKTVPALAKKDEDFIRLSFSPYEGIAALVSARLIERSAITSQARLSKMRRVAGGLGIMPVQLNYFGAATGRVSGGGGFNWLNLTSPDRVKDPGQKEIASAIRESFEAPPGYVFVSADSSQIEARLSAWLTGEWGVLERFRNKVDVYSAFISDVLEEDIHKPTDADPKETHAHLKLMRHVGKEAVLGLSYMMSWRKFILRLREDPDVARMFEAGDLTDEFCKSVVTKYRELHPAIVQGWKDLNDGFFKAKNGGKADVGPITFSKGTPIGSKLPVVNATLPSGRVMYYRNIRQEEFEGKKEWKHGAGQRLYGGLLLENMCQATAREVLIESIIRCELDIQAPVVLHIYDSIVLLVEEKRADDVRTQLVQSLRTNPDWAGDHLVLDAESKMGRTMGEV